MADEMIATAVGSRVARRGRRSLRVATPLHAQASLEYSVKAALLLNFARFIEWPDQAFPDARVRRSTSACSRPIRSARRSTERFTGETIAIEHSSARQVKSAGRRCRLSPAVRAVRRGIARQRNGPSQRVLHRDRGRVAPLRRAWAARSASSSKSGRVRFNVNLRPVEERGIRISARMLQLASRVERATPEK